MNPLRRVCERSIIENESEYKEYLTTFRKKYDNNLEKIYTIFNFNLTDIERILNDYVTTHNKKIGF